MAESSILSLFSLFPSLLSLALFSLLVRALFGHWDNDPNVIYHIGSGSGGVEEMVLEMEKSQVMYALGTYVCVCV